MAHHQQIFGYSDFSSSHNSSMQSFEPNHELFGLQAGMEILGMPSKHHPQNSEEWKGFFPKAEGSSSSGSVNLMISPDATAAMANSWQQPNRLFVDDSSLRCLFPCQGADGNRPNQDLSLSLSDNTIGLQQNFHQHLSSESRDGFLKAINTHQHQQQQQMWTMDARFFPYYEMTSSRYLIPAQELLNEFCNLGGEYQKQQQKSRNKEGESSSSLPRSQSLFSMDILELQKRKAKLLCMLEEVDRRYMRYCEQMRAVVSNFEVVAGEGAATVYSALVSKAMSRHFRCLRDGIVNQIQGTKKAMGEKDPIAPGTTKGETPRLKLLDQCLRQHKAFQQAGVMESHPWRPQRGLPERSVTVLRAWLFEHFLHPYPSDVDKHILARQTGLSRSQVSNWFINARVRLWKPMVEEMYLEETKEQDNLSSQGTADNEDDDNNSSPNQLLHSKRNPNPSSTSQYQKPIHIDSDSLSSIISTSNHHRMNGRQQQQQQVVPRAENFGVVDLDFSSYNNNCSRNQNFGGNGVSLTLGLQQHSGGGMSLSFSPASQQSLFFSREQIEDCQPVQFSILDGDQAQNLPYRNLMGAQLLHDSAG